VVEVFSLNFTPTALPKDQGHLSYTDLWYVFGFLALLVIFWRACATHAWAGPLKR
jgi:hypothetical protein